MLYKTIYKFWQDRFIFLRIDNSKFIAINRSCLLHKIFTGLFPLILLQISLYRTLTFRFLCGATVTLHCCRKSDTQDYPTDCSLVAKALPMRNFVIGSTQSVYAQITPKGTDIQVILRNHDSPIHSVITHPTE